MEGAGPSDARATWRIVFRDGCTVSELYRFATEWMQWVHAVTRGYIWSCDAFELHVVNPAGAASHGSGTAAASVGAPTGSRQPYMHGSVRFGDSVEDEWLCTWLLYEISKRADAVGAGAVAVITESEGQGEAEDATSGEELEEGQFLLFEAADVLPRWMNPETTRNRVFIHNGALHFVSPAGTPRVPADGCCATVPTLASGAAIVRRYPDATRASASVQSVIADKMTGFPARAQSFIHVARCALLPAAAALLAAHPALSSAAAAAVCHREERGGTGMLLRLPLLTAASQQLCNTSALALYPVSVPFNRVSFAQLCCVSLQPAKAYTPLLPSHLQQVKLQPQGIDTSEDAEVRAYSCGWKLAVGLELLLSEGGSASRVRNALAAASASTAATDATSSVVPESSSATSPAAATTVVVASSEEAVPSPPSPSRVATDALCNWLSQHRGINTAASSPHWLPAGLVLQTDRDDGVAWMDATAAEEQLNALLSAAEAHGASAPDGNGSDGSNTAATGGHGEEARNLSSVVSSLQRFMNMVSDLEGAEVGGDREGVQGAGSHEEEDEEEEEAEADSDNGSGDEHGEGSTGSDHDRSSSGATAAAAPASVAPSAVALDVDLFMRVYALAAEGTSASGDTVPALGDADAARLLQRAALDRLGALPPVTATEPVRLRASGMEDNDMVQLGSVPQRYAAWQAAQQGNTASTAESEAAELHTKLASLSLQAVMDAMDEELGGTSLATSFLRLPSATSAADSSGSGTLSLSPAEVQYNVAAGIGSSVSAQGAASGPATALLGRLGVAVPAHWRAGAAS